MCLMAMHRMVTLEADLPVYKVFRWRMDKRGKLTLRGAYRAKHKYQFGKNTDNIDPSIELLPSYDGHLYPCGFHAMRTITGAHRHVSGYENEMILRCIIPAGTTVTCGLNCGYSIVTPVLIIPPLEEGSEI